MLGDPLARDSQLIKQFIVEDSKGRKPVVGRDGGNPAGFIRASDPGVLVVGYHSNPSTVEETAEKFNQYLKEEGLDSIAALRARRNETNSKVHELFSRCAKSLVFAAPASGAQGDRVLGFPLELVAERNPYSIRAGEVLPLRLTYESRPLAGALVIAMNRQNPSEKLHPQHVERLAAYWAEALGGPCMYSESYGDETAVVRIHSGNGVHDEMDRRAIACFDQALAPVQPVPAVLASRTNSAQRIRKLVQQRFIACATRSGTWIALLLRF